MNFMANDLDAILRRDLMSFVAYCFMELNPQTELLPNWHIELIAAKLEAVALGRTKRLIINLPPRNLKSIAASVGFPAWYLGLKPAGHIITASYGQDLATKFARDTRTIMSSAWYQRLFPTRISSQQRATSDFATIQGGSRLAASVGGPLTGRGADIIVIDDAIKPEDALSDALRSTANEWFDSTVRSRLNNKETGAIVIIMQRLHQDDLVGHVLEQGEWDVLSLPAIAEIDEEYIIETALGRMAVKRKAGEALHPERESVSRLAEMRASMGEYNFASQYQQTPQPKGGAVVKTSWLRFCTPEEMPKRFPFLIHSWDTANKTSDLNDFSVCTTWGYADNKYYLLDVVRRRLTYPDLKRAVIEQRKKFGSGSVIIEDKASGTQLIQDLKHDGVWDVRGIDHIPGTDKLMRLHSKTPLFENGAVLLPKEAPWLNDYISELTGFPGTKFDDQVDSTTQALEYLQGPGQGIETGQGIEIWLRCGRAFRGG